MQFEKELLQQALLELEQLRQREARARLDAESLLGGLDRLSSAQSQKDSVLAILFVLASIIDVDDAMVLCQQEDGKIVSLAETSSQLRVTDGRLSASLGRAFNGKPVVMSNATAGDLSSCLGVAELEQYESVAMIAITPVDHPAVIVCLKRAAASYSKTDLDRLKYFVPLAAHAIRHAFKLAELRDVVGELEQARAAAEACARTDPLTGLANRMHFEEFITGQLNQGNRCGLALIDLNDFKPINDNFGHQAGDYVLIEIGRRLELHLGEKALVARIGGDEFGVVMTNAICNDELAHLGQRICDVFKESITFDFREYEISASIGIARTDIDDTSAKDVLLAADNAMFSVKAQRKNGYSVAARMHDRSLLRIINAQTLSDAIVEKQIVPYYQPQYEVASGRLVGFEVLARWHHPEHGLILPGEFMPEVERAGISARFTHMMLESALVDSRAWALSGLPPHDLSVNLMQANLGSPSAVEGLLDLLMTYAEQSGKVVFEITESVFLGRSSEQVAKTLTSVTKAGVRLSLDDFGTGFASLSNLPQLPFDELKIDRAFVSEIGKGSPTETIIESVVKIAHAHTARVVAEGIETPEQFDFLRRIGCDLAQGFMLGMPADAKATRDLLTQETGQTYRVGL